LLAELIEELDEIIQEADNSSYRIYGDIMKRRSDRFRTMDKGNGLAYI